MRVYLPATVSAVAAALAGQPRQFSRGTGYAVTPGLREWYASGDTEELEYAALSLAAVASLSLIAADPTAARRRVVVAAEIAEPSAVVAESDVDRTSRGLVTVVQAIPLAWVAAAHVDGADAVAAVSAAVQDLSDDFAAGEVADHELLWYATQELETLVQELAG